MKTAIDNSALAKMDTLADVGMKEDIMTAFSSRRHSFYGTNELAVEVLAMNGSGSKVLMPGRIGLLLRLLERGRMLNHYGQIIQGELEAENRIFPTSGETNLLKAKLESVASTGSLGELASYIEDSAKEKERAFAHRCAYQERIRQGLKEPSRREDARRRYGEYAAFEAFMLPQVARELTQGFLKKEVRPLAHKRLESAHEHLDDFPYIKLFFRIATARIFYNWIMDRRVDYGDSCDDEQLVYLAGLDLMVTEDQRFRELGRILFTTGSVLSVDAFRSLP